ncbi:MAG: hypothetical protein JOZ75_06405 [Candidatus Dormibacteraeota bacterium]|nr:hypothetical protein [Candidatus Dormibacteraeota bacterium]
MYKAAVPFPVLPGKDASQVAAVLRADPAGYAESRRRAGVHLERAYEMPTPMGTFLIAYLESDRPYAEATAEAARSELAVDRAFAAAVKEVHGIDITQPPPPGPPPEVLGDWVDETVTTRKRGIAFCVPVLAGAEETGRAFAREAYTNRRDEFAASRRAIGACREVAVLNTTPSGQLIAVYGEADDPVEANRLFAQSTSPYDVWFKEQLTRIFPPDVDFNVPLPPITEIFDSQEILVAR